MRMTYPCQPIQQYSRVSIAKSKHALSWSLSQNKVAFQPKGRHTLGSHQQTINQPKENERLPQNHAQIIAIHVSKSELDRRELECPETVWSEDLYVVNSDSSSSDYSSLSDSLSPSFHNCGSRRNILLCLNGDAGDEAPMVSANADSQRRNSEEISEGKVPTLKEVGETVGVILNKSKEVVKNPIKMNTSEGYNSQKIQEQTVVMILPWKNPKD